MKSKQNNSLRPTQWALANWMVMFQPTQPPSNCQLSRASKVEVGTRTALRPMFLMATKSSGRSSVIQVPPIHASQINEYWTPWWLGGFLYFKKPPYLHLHLCLVGLTNFNFLQLLFPFLGPLQMFNWHFHQARFAAGRWPTTQVLLLNEGLAMSVQDVYGLPGSLKIGCK